MFQAVEVLKIQLMTKINAKHKHCINNICLMTDLPILIKICFILFLITEVACSNQLDEGVPISFFLPFQRITVRTPFQRITVHCYIKDRFKTDRKNENLLHVYKFR